MDSDEILNILIEKNILNQNNSDLSLSMSFMDEIHNEKSTPDKNHPSEIANELSDTPILLSSYLVLKEKVDMLSAEDMIQALTLISHFLCDIQKNEYIPEAFLTIPGKHLDSLLPLYRHAIVYVWERDCSSCALIKEDFNDLIGSHPNDLVLFAVNNHEWKGFLNDNYDVVGAPTILFVVDGVVDARLIGAHSPRVVSSEIDKLYELTQE